MHPSLLLWLTAQPPEIQSVIRSLAQSNGLTLFWDSWADQPVAVAVDTAAHVLQSLDVESLGLAVAVRVGVGAR